MYNQFSPPPPPRGRRPVPPTQTAHEADDDSPVEQTGRRQPTAPPSGAGRSWRPNLPGGSPMTRLAGIVFIGLVLVGIAFGVGRAVLSGRNTVQTVTIPGVTAEFVVASCSQTKFAVQETDGTLVCGSRPLSGVPEGSVITRQTYDRLMADAVAPSAQPAPPVGQVEADPNPRAPRSWELNDQIDSIREDAERRGLQVRNLVGVLSAVTALLTVLTTLSVLMDGRERGQMHDGVVAVLAAFSQYGFMWIWLFVSEFAYQFWGIQDPTAMAIIDRAIALVIVVICWGSSLWVSLTGGRDFSALGGFHVLIALLSVWFPRMGAFGVLVGIPDGSQHLTSSEMFLYWQAGVGVLARLSLWTMLGVVWGVALLAIDFLHINSLWWLITKNPNLRISPNWAALASIPLAVSAAVWAIRSSDIHPVITVGLALVGGNLIANLGRKFGGQSTNRPTRDPGEVLVGWSPYLPWDATIITSGILLLIIVVFGLL